MPLVVWQFLDGKAGHDNQSAGLVAALARLRPVHLVTLEPLPPLTALDSLLRGRLLAWRDQPAPEILCGAGHGTHLSLLAARRARGGKIILLMHPSLPLRLFDLCLIPEHDAPPPRRNVVVTRGALNRIQRSTSWEPSWGLLLIGGPSAHFGWNDAELCRQIALLVAADPTIHWTLATSRRTPPSFLERLTVTAKSLFSGEAEPFGQRLTVVPITKTGPEWLPTQLAHAGQAWVSADSVSMIYEALTAGTAVGVLEVPRQRPNRISRGLAHLATEGWVTFFSDWRRNRQLRRPTQPFNEAERCARWIIDQWLG